MKIQSALLSASVLFTACTTGSPEYIQPYDLSHTSWILEATALGDIWLEPEAGTEITLTFSGNTFEGFAGCNSFTGAFEQNIDGLLIKEINTTRKHCGGDIQHQEDTFLENLRKVYEVEFVEQVAHFPIRGGSSSLVLRRYEEPQIIDFGGLHTYDTCVNAGGLQIGADNQCAISGKVYFKDHRPNIELASCTAYDDGCNYHSVANGELGSTTLAACPIERDVPACFIDDYRISTTYGEIMQIRGRVVTLRSDDILEDFTVNQRKDLNSLKTGDYASIRYGTSGTSEQRKIFSITED